MRTFMIKIIVNGAAGRMGTTIVRLASANPDLKIVGAIDRKECQQAGWDAGEVAGVSNLGVLITNNLAEIISGADVVIDFSSPEATAKLIDVAGGSKTAVVVGTTGHSDQQKEAFKNAAKTIPLLVSPNMSVGVNLLWKLTETAAKTLNDEYAIDIVERHHIHKKDAPSGTAKKLIELITKATGKSIEKDVYYALDGSNEAASNKPITVKAIREGEVVGDHTVYFTSKEDRIELAHFAFTRDIFGNGALRAAEWIVDKPAGLYDMQSVLF